MGKIKLNITEQGKQSFVVEKYVCLINKDDNIHKREVLKR